MSVEGIPSYILQNIASIQANISSIMSDSLSNGGAKVNFGNFLSSAVDDITSTFSDTAYDSFSADEVLDMPYGNSSSAMPGISGNSTRPDVNAMQQMLNNQNSNVSNPEAAASVKKAYDALLNGDMAKQLAPSIASVDSNSLMEKLKRINSTGLDKNTSLITDEEFFDADTLNPAQITDILKKKGSPYAYQTFEGGKSIGQLIYNECHKAGTVEQGSHTLNPALILAIMGAESGFGTDPKTVKTNPFNIRVNGSFDNTPNLETSLNMAVNTMYNWAKSRPESSKVSLLDYAGDKYCENYNEKWKPNVEKYFLEFTINHSSPATLPEEDQKQKLVKQVMSSLNLNGSMAMGSESKGLNIENLIKMATSNGKVDSKLLSNINLLSTMNSSPLLDNKEE